MTSETDLTRLEALKDFERRHDLFACRVDGWAPWRVLRGPVQLLARNLPSGTDGRSNIARAVEAVGATLRLVSALMFAPRRTLLVKTCRTSLRMKCGESYRDVHFDGLLERGHSFFKLEEVNSRAFDSRAAVAMFPAHLNPAAFYFWGRVLGTLFPVRAAEPFCRDLSALLKKELNLEAPPSWLMMRISTVKWQALIYRQLLKRIRPESVLVSETGEFPLRVATAALGIPMIELQHGVFDRHHRDAVPADVEGSTAALLLPDFLASKGQFWVDELSGTRQGGRSTVPVGNELIERARESRSARPEGAQRVILFTSQGLCTEAVVDWLNRAVEAAPADLDWKIVLKLHPFYDRDTRAYEGLVQDARVQIISGASDPHVFDLLAEADLHLSISSACLFDAAAIGVKSGILPFATHESLLYAVDGDALTVLSSPQGLWPLLLGPPMNASESVRYSAPGFVRNMEELVLKRSSSGP